MANFSYLDFSNTNERKDYGYKGTETNQTIGSYGEKYK